MNMTSQSFESNHYLLEAFVFGRQVRGDVLVPSRKALDESITLVLVWPLRILKLQPCDALKHDLSFHDRFTHDRSAWNVLTLRYVYLRKRWMLHRVSSWMNGSSVVRYVCFLHFRSDVIIAKLEVVFRQNQMLLLPRAHRASFLLAAHFT